MSPTTRRTVLRCDKCGRMELVSDADVRGYMKGGWPKFCGQVMACFVEDECATDLPKKKDDWKT